MDYSSHMVIVRTTGTFVHWFERLADRQARLCIQARIDRFESGNRGHYRVLQAGIRDMKIN